MTAEVNAAIEGCLEAGAGEIDSDLVELFIEARIWERRPNP